MSTSVDRSGGAVREQAEREVLIRAVFADRAAWANDHTRKVHSIDDGTLIHDCLPALRTQNALDLIVLASHIAERWGVEIERSDWQEILEANPQGTCDVLREVSDANEQCHERSVTFGRLAEWVSSRIGRAAFGDLSLLDKTWPTAAAYRRIVDIAHQVRPLVLPFAPSTPVPDRLRGPRLHKFWSRVRCISSNRIPPLKLAWGERVLRPFLVLLMCGVAGCILLLAALAAIHVVGGGAGGEMLGLGQYLEGIVLLVLVATTWLSLLVAVMGGLLKLAGALVPVLPHGIRTFRDLAELVAGERGGWCEGCGYDLTGNSTGICPECGRRSVVARKSAPASGGR